MIDDELDLYEEQLLQEQLNEQPEAEGNYSVVATKVNKETYQLLEKICTKLGMQKYGLFQLMADTIVRMCDEKHNLTPELNKAIMMFEKPESWKKCFTLSDYTTQPEILEAVYFLHEPNHKGVRMVMVERPWLEGSDQWVCTYNLQKIFEEFIVNMSPERYRRLRLLAFDNDCNSLLELLDSMIDTLSKDADGAEIRTWFEDANRSEYGRKPADAPFKRKHHKTVNDDRLTDRQQGSLFEYDNEPEL